MSDIRDVDHYSWQQVYEACGADLDGLANPDGGDGYG